jgi:hypothetical protein
MVVPSSRRVPQHERIPKGELARLSREERLSHTEIARRIGVTRQAVHQLLKVHGIATRDGSQARLLALAQGKVAGKSLRRKVVVLAKVPRR